MDTVLEFLENVEHAQRKADAIELLSIMRKASGYEPHLAGSMVGFGSYHYKYDSGREGDSFVTGFAPRKQNLVVYVIPGYSDIQDKLDKLGKYKTGSSCLYLNKLSDVDKDVLADIVRWSVKEMQSRYECQPLP